MRCVPQMKNIISMGAVKSKELKATIDNGILKITKGSMVVMRGAKDRNLELWQLQLTWMKMLPDVAHETWSRG